MKIDMLKIAVYLIVIAAGMKAAASILNVVLLAVLLGTSLMPIILWLMKKGVPKAVSLLITIFVLIIVTVLIASTLSVAVIGLADKIPQYEQQLQSIKLNTVQILSNYGIDIGNVIQNEMYQPENIMTVAADFILGIISTFSNFAVVFLLVIFLLIDTAGLRYRIYNNEKDITEGQLKFAELAAEIRNYISISAFTGLLTALGNLILLLVMSVEFALLWAFLSFLFSFVPNIGFVLSVIAPAFIALGDSGPTAAIIVLVGFIIINGIIENIVRPKFMGKELNMSLTLIFLSLIFWTWILGAMGAILAIPLTMSALKAREILFTDGD
jgi:predicted PurR-regulated permease PerM